MGILTDNGRSPIHPAPEEFTADEIGRDPILRFFHYKHLPPVLADVSSSFCTLARFIVDALPRSAERTVALRKLLEAKDAGVRSLVGFEQAKREAPSPVSEVKSTATHDDRPSEEIGDGVRMIGGDRSETPVPFND